MERDQNISNCANHEDKKLLLTPHQLCLINGCRTKCLAVWVGRIIVCFWRYSSQNKIRSSGSYDRAVS